MIQQSLREKAFIGGGKLLGKTHFRKPKGYTSIVTAAAVTAAADGYGNTNFNYLPIKQVLRLKYPTFRREPRNGTKLSIACSAIYRRIGSASH